MLPIPPFMGTRNNHSMDTKNDHFLRFRRPFPKQHFGNPPVFCLQNFTVNQPLGPNIYHTLSYCWFNDFAHIPWEDTPNFPKPPQRKEILHKLLVKHLGYLPGVCGWDLRLMVQKSGVHQLRLVVYGTQYLQGFRHPNGGRERDFWTFNSMCEHFEPLVYSSGHGRQLARAQAVEVKHMEVGAWLGGIIEDGWSITVSP